MNSLKIAIINEICTAGATRCARDLEQYLSLRHTVRYYPRQGKETVLSLLEDLTMFMPDVIHCHSYYGDLPYHLLATLSQKYPTCFTPHDPRPIGTIETACWNCSHYVWCFRCPLVTRYRKIFLYHPYFWQRLHKRYIHRNAAATLHIIAPSQWLQQRMMATELFRFTMHHIPYGINLDHFRHHPYARRPLGLPETPPIIFYVAHPNQSGWYSNPRKGLRYLADAFVEVVLPKFPECLLLVAGERLVPNHPNVRPVGFLSQDILPLYYSAADVFAVPTLADNLPYTVLEAMGCETPVVAFHVGGIPEEIEHGVTGYLVPPMNSNALGLALLSVLESPEKRRTMGQHGRMQAMRLFNMERFIEQHECIYHALTQ